MAGIIYTVPGGGGQNPTANFMPLNIGLPTFVDSDIVNISGSQLYFNPSSGLAGVYCDFVGKIAKLGNFGATDVNITIDSSTQKVDIIGPAGVINSASAGGASGQHLCISVNGTAYKIALLNP